MSDVRALWAAVEAAVTLIPPAATSLYSLAASTTFLHQQRERHPQPPANADLDKLVTSLYQGNERLTPRAAILKNKVIEQALQLLPRHESGVESE